MSQPVFLYAPPEYWKLSREERESYLCGPGRGVLEWLVPDSILGVNVQPACAIHDFMYAQGMTPADKDEADRVFLNNLIRLIESHGGYKWLQKMRLSLAQDYYEAVSHFGGPAFWVEKNKHTEMGLVSV